MIISRGSEQPEVETPAHVAEFIYQTVSEVLRPQTVVDIGIGLGSLSRPWGLDSRIIGIDRRSIGRVHSDKFLNIDFLTIPQPTFKPDLILCNPPWSGYRPMPPYLFLKKAHELWGTKVPGVWIVPAAFLHNLTGHSYRYGFLHDLNITGSTPLPMNTFPGYKVWAVILFINLPGVAPMSFLPPQPKPPKKPRLTKRHRLAALLPASQPTPKVGV